MKLQGKITDSGKFSWLNPIEFSEQIKQFWGKIVDVTFEIHRVKRSINQNDWYWSCIVPAFLDGYINENHDREIWLRNELFTIEIHDGKYSKTALEIGNQLLQQKYNSFTIQNKETGEIESFNLGTHNLNTKEFADYCEICRRFIFDFYQIYIEDPDKNWKSNIEDKNE
jgi:hypothetical protein